MPPPQQGQSMPPPQQGQGQPPQRCIFACSAPTDVACISACFPPQFSSRVSPAIQAMQTCTTTCPADNDDCQRRCVDTMVLQITGSNGSSPGMMPNGSGVNGSMPPRMGSNGSGGVNASRNASAGSVAVSSMVVGLSVVLASVSQL